MIAGNPHSQVYSASKLLLYMHQAQQHQRDLLVLGKLKWLGLGGRAGSAVAVESNRGILAAATSAPAAGSAGRKQGSARGC
jgi:hypothetical protein